MLRNEAIISPSSLTCKTETWIGILHVNKNFWHYIHEVINQEPKVITLKSQSDCMVWLAILIIPNPNKSTVCGTNAHLSWARVLLKIFSSKGHNSKNIDFRVMPLVLHLYLVIMSKHSKFILIPLILFLNNELH